MTCLGYCFVKNIFIYSVLTENYKADVSIFLVKNK